MANRPNEEGSKCLQKAQFISKDNFTFFTADLSFFGPLETG
jgi:hypothetical protein